MRQGGTMRRGSTHQLGAGAAHSMREKKGGGRTTTTELLLPAPPASRHAGASDVPARAAGRDYPVQVFWTHSHVRSGEASGHAAPTGTFSLDQKGSGVEGRGVTVLLLRGEGGMRARAKRGVCVRVMDLETESA